ncbi:MAG: tripartite tricarboxylate transporter substrate binding protein [Desulfobacterales bacterium]|nr:tripartite tricarboxylate transporter substrate binding protein [Desulfobacterales bacterium]
MKTKHIVQSILVVLLVGFLCIGPAIAADYPEKPITLIIPLGAGGSHDLNARVFTSVIPTYLGQPMVIKLMPGAGGQTGTAAAVRAKADGYTLIFTHNFIDQLQPVVEQLPYDTTKELTSVWRLNYGPPCFYGLADRPYKTLQEMLDYGKKNPGKLRFGTTGKWGAGFTPGAVVLTRAGVEAAFIPYQGGGPALQATLAGDVDFTVGFPAQGLPHLKTGKLRFYAVGAEKRLEEAPDVPTLPELGYPVGSLLMSRIILAPRGTPPERINILREAFKKLYQDKTFLSLMKNLGENIEFMDGPDYEKVRAEQKEEYTSLVKKITG